jgi:hypothetical protein
MRRFAVSLLIVISAVCLVLSSTALWARRYVVDTEVFVSGARVVLAEPAVQAWVASRVTDAVVTPGVRHVGDEVAALLPPELQSFRPAFEGGVRSMLREGVRTLLASDSLSAPALASAHAQLAEGRAVRLTLGQAMSSASTGFPIGQAGQLLDLLPNDLGVTVLTPQDAPLVYTAVELLKLLWLWTGLLAIAALAGALVVSRRPLAAVRAWAVTAAGLGLLLIALPAARASVLAHVEPGGRDAAGAVYAVLTDGLRSWTLWLLAGTGVVAVVASVSTLRALSGQGRRSSRRS